MAGKIWLAHRWADQEAEQKGSCSTLLAFSFSLFSQSGTPWFGVGYIQGGSISFS